MEKTGYLGPRGTFSEEAALSALKINENNLVSYPSAAAVIKAVDDGDVIKQGIVPLENSIEGSVNVTLDTLVFDSSDEVLIQKEIVSNIHHNLIAPAKTSINDIKRVYSHPQAAAQCRKYIKNKLPRADVIASSSTAEAAKIAYEQNNSAAIGTKLASKLYDLEQIDNNIEDFKENKTRFVLIGKEQAKRTGEDKTSIACFIKKDQPGMLLQILQEFADRDINLTKIQSRPTKKALGEYYFWIDLEGHIKDEIVGDLLDCLKHKLRKVRFLGSYPKSK
ncbi:hypothetical protein LCGC14_1221210 [marine sediment metagenome]|uniref:prephenate dehydratase n=1 Tax=marine sediment metagenome TaxID=412755 RepID=A0A0F9LB64_9ZZZZ